MNNDNITFGVELEFICVYPRHTFNSLHVLVESEFYQDHVPADHALWHLLNGRGIPTTGFEELGTSVDEKPYCKWAVVEECGLVLSEAEELTVPDGYEVCPIELTSRIYTSEREAEREIPKVLLVLQQMERVYGCKFITNAATGLHLHMGNGGDPLPFHLVQRVAQLMTAHERAFDSIHAANRILAPAVSRFLEYEEAPLNAPPSFWHRLREGEASSNLSWLCKIQSASSVEDIAAIHRGACSGDHLYTYGKQCNVNYDNMFPDEEYDRTAYELKHTIEFRQHAGTLDGQAIPSYIYLIHAVFKFCNAADDATFILLLLQGADYNFGLLSLLQALCVPPSAVRHYVGVVDFELGELPTPHTISAHPDCRLLEKLTEQNEAEQSEKLNRDAILRATDRKWQDQCYGWDPTLTAIPVKNEDVLWLLERAALMRTADKDTRSVAIWNVLKCLATVYPHMDNSLSPERLREIVARHFSQ